MAGFSADGSSAMAQSRLRALRSELNGLLFRNVPGYHEKYFPDLATSASQRDHSTSAWRDTIPTSPQTSSLEKNPWSDLLSFIVQLSSDAMHGSNTFIHRSTNEVVLATSSSSPSSYLDPDAAVLVTGLCQTDADAASDNAILAFCDRVVTVFAARPHRLFLHAFRIYGSNIETWTFDRAGAYSGRIIDVQNEPDSIGHIVATYLSMDNDRLGLNPVYHIEGQQQFVKLKDTRQNEQLLVESEPFVRQEYFTGPGTSCFRAYRIAAPLKRLIVKFAWTPDGFPGEFGFLEIVKDRNICGVIKLEGHQFLCNIADLRCGLQFDQAFAFSASDENRNHSIHDSDSKSTAPVKSTPALASDVLVQTPRFENLKFECIVTSPLGQPLDSFSTPSELLRILSDIVQALKSLYLKANIIHRDISTQNIIIAPRDDSDADTARGLLIDLNLALDVTRRPEKEDLVGSEGFMAVGILGGDDATYRHDLESVFYVFIWMAICHNGTTSKHVPENSCLHAWCGTNWLASFYSKKNDMQPVNFAKWTKEEFTASFQPYLPLATHLHKLLFPMKNGSIFIGTDPDIAATAQLYEDMINAFREAASS